MKINRKILLGRITENKVLSGNGQSIVLDVEGPNKTVIKLNILVHFELSLNDNSFNYSYGDINSSYQQDDMDFEDFYYDIKSYGLKNASDKTVQDDEEDYKKIAFLGGWTSVSDLDDTIVDKAKDYIIQNIDEFKE